MGQLWAGRRNMVDMLFDIGPGKSLGYRIEAGRLLGLRTPAGLAQSLGVTGLRSRRAPNLR